MAELKLRSGGKAFEALLALGEETGSCYAAQGSPTTVVMVAGVANLALILGEGKIATNGGGILWGIRKFFVNLGA